MNSDVREHELISVDLGEIRFQYRVAAIIVVDGSVLLQREESDEIWALPGGRVEPGEDARAALWREITEELGEHAEFGELAYVVENFFDHGGTNFHEIGMYFAAQLPSGSAFRDRSQVYRRSDEARCLEFRWFPITGLLGVPLRPAFLREALGRMSGHALHVVQRR